MSVAHVVVAGGGVTGLAAAARLREEGVDVTLLEAADRLGGKVTTVDFGGRPLDLGPEMLVAALAREPLEELGLAARLVAPRATGASVWTRGALRPLPPGLLAGLPGGAGALVRGRTLTPRGLLRAGLDVVRPSEPVEADVSIGALVRERLGDEAFEVLIEPLLGGIHAGRCDTLSARALAPQLVAAIGSGHGLVRGLRAAAPPSSGAPPFVSLEGGLGTLIARLEERAAGTDVRLDTPVFDALPTGDGLRVNVQRGALDADAVVLALPAAAAARALDSAAPSAAAELRAIRYASVTTVALAFAPGALGREPQGSGFLVPPREGRLITACTYASRKWPHLAGEREILKVSVGRDGAPPPDVADDELVRRVEAELDAVLDLRSSAIQTAVARFPAALPQYDVGHLERVARIEEALPARLQLAGAPYRGAGVPACLKSGRAAAERVLDGLPRRRVVPSPAPPRSST